MANPTPQVGQLYRAIGTFQQAGINADPTAVFMKYQDPSGAITSLAYGTDGALVKDAVGVYHVDINCTLAGTWLVHFYSTGSGQASFSSNFFVYPSAP